MELDFDKYRLVDRSPTTVLPPPRSRKSSGKPKYGNDIPTLSDEDLIEINFSPYHSASCRDVQSQSSRGSVYQSSEEVRLLQKTDAVVRRKKIEFSRETASVFSFGIIDSLCCSDEDSSLVEHNRPSVVSLSEQSTTSVCENHIELRSRDSMTSSQSVTAPINEANSLEERDMTVNLQKSLSARLALPHSPAKSESVGSRASSLKPRFRPVRKMFDPFVKSKSHRNLLSSSIEAGCGTGSGLTGIDSKKTICKSLLNDLSDKSCRVEYDYHCEEKENHNSVPWYSPAHLHGLLKLGNKRGVPFFEFSVKSPEDVYVAKTWKVKDALTGVYTFHSLRHRRQSSASGWGFKDSNLESSPLGQMQVSCRLCTESEGAGELNDSMVTEFVLYDILHSRKSTSSQDNSSSSPDDIKAPVVSDEILSWGNCEPNEILAKTKSKGQLNHSRQSSRFELSACQPLAATDLRPELEIAAIVMQAPSEKRESLKFNSGDKKIDEKFPDSLDLCQLGKAKDGSSNNSNHGKMHVVIPAGNHSLPITESHGPSRLLDRWRLGGGCDCGGWDMACPLSVFSNPNVENADGQPLMDNQNPMELFFQGRKDDIPAFTMRMIEDGKYAVDFHAQLSSLQAFSICIAILHTADASTVTRQERRKQILQSGSLRVLAEEEVKNTIDAIAEEEKPIVNKKTEEILPFFVINPPFSPIARV
ncbi:uncharacterized protein LOC105157872 [Sesamum indicum]|uniref:Uncharacterized protein LOC105157872 n=1 Tax=Sesamum indicum TaxID=4182 RepID=A0A6I9SS01_SESIN|nr:uncharacterized protein LOC105157872 [Sesamum indicum]XP_011072687.1 uncharacterized protein LOC105157872 [Sesamum indicum]XP_011072697.1 uncharacterized protein LOC105157872 [Sesamum indicum]XP_011072705.1 uncharacterized protein LOC105157872 [Sesamum indicum]XP_011072713.1 uncharacterized protein LOC105157872 [Sesamum indicum]XP_020548251.1 uncharacterized protein LOC105157872 [Sesamum indicum]